MLNESFAQADSEKNRETVNLERVLDLTKPGVAQSWGYNSALSYESTQAIGERAAQQGYRVIAYPAIQGAGTNFAVVGGFAEILRPMGITPGPP
jgi:hypothetical protein